MKLAYSLWEERDCPEGSPEVDCFKADEALTTNQNSRDLSYHSRTQIAVLIELKYPSMVVTFCHMNCDW